MIQSRHHPAARTRLLAGTAACLLGAACLQAVPAAAQSELDSTLVASEAPLDAEQTRAVEAFINARLQTFTTDDAQAIYNARVDLLAPLTRINAAGVFKISYTRLLTQQLAQQVQSFSRLGRINAQVMTASLGEADVLPIIRAGLGDDEPAVRFAAGDALIRELKRRAQASDNLPGSARTALIDRTLEIAAAEPSPLTAGKMMDALNQLTGDNPDRLLQVLNSRVAIHASQPTLSFAPEDLAFRGLFLNLSNQATTEQRTAFVQAAARYFKLASEQLAAGGLGADQLEARRNFGVLLNNILRSISPGMGLAQRDHPADAAPAITSGNFAEVATLADAWITALTDNSPLTAEQLSTDG